MTEDEWRDAWLGAYMWGFQMPGTARRDGFANDAGRDAFMAHVRGCPKTHDPRGKAFGGCADVEDSWFAPEKPE